MNADTAREKMIEQQVRAWDVFDPIVLAVLEQIPRERFVPPIYAAFAFADTEVPIGHGETMMTPSVEGRLLQALSLTGSENVLEIGTGSGFVTACLATLAATVTSVDIHRDFLEQADAKLAAAKLGNVSLACMDAMRDLPPGEFDAIAVTGSLPAADSRLLEILRPGGRLFWVVGKSPAMDAQQIRRLDDGEWESESLFETDLQPLVNASPGPKFLF